MKVVDGKAVYDSPEEEAAFKTLLDAEVTGLKGKNAELIGKLKTFDGFKDVDPNEYRTLKEQAAKIEEERLLKAGEFDNLKKQLLEAHGKEKAVLEAKISTLSKSLEENVLIATATQAIAAEKGSALLLMPHVRSRTKLDDNGNPVVIDESGNVRVDSAGKPINITALIAEMKADIPNYGRAFEASGQSGTGSQQSGSGGSGKTMTLTAFNEQSPVERSKFMAAGGTLTD